MQSGTIPLMKPTNAPSSSNQIKFIVGTLAVVGVVLVALYFLVLNLALANNGVFNLHIPSRSSGDDFNLDSSQFTIMHAIAIGIAVYLTGMSLWFARQNQSQIAMFMTIGMVIYASVYSALILGNVLSEEYGAFASVLGVVVSLGAASLFSSYGFLKAASNK